MQLHKIAHGRTGGKGDKSNISVIAYHAEDWDRLVRDVTAERVAAHFGPDFAQEITRYVLLQLHAMNFVMKGAVAGGVIRSLALTPMENALRHCFLRWKSRVPDRRAKCAAIRPLFT